MVRIVSDTSTLYSTTQALEAGFDVAPLSVTIAGKTYREFDEISADQFVDIIRQGNMPTSSQPALGLVTETYEKYPEEEIVHIAMADGLSGTYNGARAAADLVENSDRITVINCATLCGPHRYMVEKAVEWAKAGQSRAQIVEKIEEMIKQQKSYLMPDDFGYLRRGGRLSPLVAFVGQAGGLAPIMTQTDDGKQLVIAGIRRGFANAIKQVAKNLQSAGVGAGWRVYITHGSALEKAQKALEIIKEVIPDAVFEIHPLSPAFITQGGPSCVAVQYIKEAE